VPGVRTPFVKAGTAFKTLSALELSATVAKAMVARAHPDMMIWGQVIPDPDVSNIGRELVFEADIDPETPSFSDVMACSTSFVGAIAAAGILGKGGVHLAMVGGVETMSHVPIALKQRKADEILAAIKTNRASLSDLASIVQPQDFNLPQSAWNNRVSGRSMGEHTEDTAKLYHITREAQDRLALASHQRAVSGWESGFFGDLVIAVAGTDHDLLPRPDSTLEKLSSLPPVFDRSPAGTLTAGNSSPLTDGAAAIWVADEQGIERLGYPRAVRLVDWEIAAMAFEEEGILMAPARAIPRLLARNQLRASEIQLWELHEAFAAQVIANIEQAINPEYRKKRAKVDFDLGPFPYERLNPNGGSLALGHPFGATGARILSQAAKELAAMPFGSRAVVSVCADGGQGTVALLEHSYSYTPKS
jgi:acetyl-CoA C-acetyltransferase/acetyl-CoA acyltransferase